MDNPSPAAPRTVAVEFLLWLILALVVVAVSLVVSTGTRNPDSMVFGELKQGQWTETRREVPVRDPFAGARIGARDQSDEQPLRHPVLHSYLSWVAYRQLGWHGPHGLMALGWLLGGLVLVPALFRCGATGAAAWTAVPLMLAGSLLQWHPGPMQWAVMLVGLVLPGLVRGGHSGWLDMALAGFAMVLWPWLVGRDGYFLVLAAVPLFRWLVGEGRTTIVTWAVLAVVGIDYGMMVPAPPLDPVGAWREAWGIGLVVPLAVAGAGAWVGSMKGPQARVGWVWALVGILCAAGQLPVPAIAPAVALVAIWPTADRFQHRWKLLGGAYLLAAVGFLSTAAQRGGPGYGPEPDRFPESAAVALGQIHGGGLLIHDDRDGMYLVWRLYPDWTLVSADHLTGESVVDLELTLSRASAVLVRHDSGLSSRLAKAIHSARVSDTTTGTSALGRRGHQPVLLNDLGWLTLRQDGVRLTQPPPFRVLIPGLPWPLQTGLLRTPQDWLDLGSDLRSLTLDQPKGYWVNQYLRAYLRDAPPEGRLE